MAMLRMVSRQIKRKRVRTSSTMFQDKYTIVEKLGTGATSTVYKVVDNKYNYFTCKKINLDSKNAALREIKILNKLPRKDYFSNFMEMIKEKDKINIIMTYVPGKDLFEWFEDTLNINRMLVTESVAKELFRNMIKIVKKLHKYGFVHLDLKLENFIIRNNSTTDLTLVDYASCHPFYINERTLSKIVGTRGYAPFEIYKGLYCSKSDVWSLGICLWLLLTQASAFDHAKLSFSNMHILTAKDFAFPTKKHLKYKNYMSDEAFDLVSRMLVVQPENRITIEEILNDPWFHTKNDLHL